MGTVYPATSWEISTALIKEETMARVLYIIRGVPGAGKSTLAEKLTVYNYVELAMTHEVEEIVVNNIFTRKWEYDP